MITLKCATCGKKTTVEGVETINFAFELIQAANTTDWYCVPHTVTTQYVTDHAIVLFCSEECYKTQLTKSGKLRRVFKQKK